MLEEKARKALAERERIVRQRKKDTPVKFKRSTRLLANQLESAKKVLASEDEYETVSESGESPRKSRNADNSFGGATPKANFKYIQNQQQIVSDILNKAVASTKQMPQIHLVIKPNVQVPIPPQSAMASGIKQLVSAKTSSFSSKSTKQPKPATSINSNSADTPTAQHSRQIGESAIENNVQSKSCVALSPERRGKTVENSENWQNEEKGIRRSKRLPHANRTAKYGAVMLGLVKYPKMFQSCNSNQ